MTSMLTIRGSEILYDVDVEEIKYGVFIKEYKRSDVSKCFANLINYIDNIDCIKELRVDTVSTAGAKCSVFTENKVINIDIVYDSSKARGRRYSFIYIDSDIEWSIIDGCILTLLKPSKTAKVKVNYEDNINIVDVINKIIEENL